MINAKELRIGNWVLVTMEDKVKFPMRWMVDFVTKIPQMQPEDTLTFMHLDGIPLTTGILKMAGFTEDYYDSTIGETIEETRFMEQSGRTKKTLLGWTNGKLSINKLIRYGDGEINYVHQLQNLCFAITGEELTINLQ